MIENANANSAHKSTVRFVALLRNINRLNEPLLNYVCGFTVILNPFRRSI